MRRPSGLVVGLLLVAVVAVATSIGTIAWAMRDNDDTSVRMGPGMMATDPGSAPDWWDGGSWRSMMGMMGWAGAVSEPEYLAEMIAHHREAVAAAGNLTRSDRAEMRSLGESIIESQSTQIRQMQDWLQEWYPEQPVDVDYQPMMRNLSELSGDRLDRAFLQDMIGHHMAAVMMSQNLLWRGTEHDQVAELARSIRDDQHVEIVQMQRWLAQWFDTDWRGGMGMGMGSGMMWGSGY